MFYFAGPMGDQYNKRNEKFVHKLEKAGFKVYLPMRDTNQEQSARRIFLINMFELKRSDVVIVVLSNTRGVYLETGYAKALGKKLIGLMVDETKQFGPITRNFFDHIVNDTDDLITILAKMPKKRKKSAKKTIKKKTIKIKKKSTKKKIKKFKKHNKSKKAIKK